MAPRAAGHRHGVRSARSRFLTVLAVLLAAFRSAVRLGRYLSPVRLVALVGSERPERLGRQATVARVAYVAQRHWGWRCCGRPFRAAFPPTIGRRRGPGPRPRVSRPDAGSCFRPAYLRHVGAYYGIRPSVEEPDSGRAWIVTQGSGLLRPASRAALPGEVARRRPRIVARRGLEVDLEFIDGWLEREHALAIEIDDDRIHLLTPEGKMLAVGEARSIRPDENGVGSRQP